MKLEIGQKVICQNTVEKITLKGTIKFIGDGRIGVEHKENHKHFHNIAGHGKEKYCWWYYNGEVQPMTILDIMREQNELLK